MASFLKTEPASKSFSFKKKDRTNPNNYRPISIFTCFAKILEHLVYNRFLAFLKKHNVTHKTQYGFQKHTSTTHAVLDIVSTAYDNISQKLYTKLVFLDLRKAFNLSRTISY